MTNLMNDAAISPDRLKRILGSCSINFLFGAGVNGNAFPQFNGFEKTKLALKNCGQPGNVIEMELRNLNENDRDKVLGAFIDEFNDQKINYESGSILNLKDLLHQTNLLISRAENRHPESKRVNIFTLNYDRIVETVLESQGQFIYTLNAKASNSYLPFEIVGYNTARREYIPTFAVYKMHGSVDAAGILQKEAIIAPGEDKLGNVISDFYETLFAMKGELLRKNSALFVIGYSWKDDHINGIIKDAIDNGLTVYQLQYKTNEDPLPSEISSKINVIPPAKEHPEQDTTLTLANLFEKVMADEGR